MVNSERWEWVPGISSRTFCSRLTGQGRYLQLRSGSISGLKYNEVQWSKPQRKIGTSSPYFGLGIVSILPGFSLPTRGYKPRRKYRSGRSGRPSGVFTLRIIFTLRHIHYNLDYPSPLSCLRRLELETAMAGRCSLQLWDLSDDDLHDVGREDVSCKPHNRDWLLSMDFEPSPARGEWSHSAFQVGSSLVLHLRVSGGAHFPHRNFTHGVHSCEDVPELPLESRGRTGYRGTERMNPRV